VLVLVVIPIFYCRYNLQWSTETIVRNRRRHCAVRHVQDATLGCCALLGAYSRDRPVRYCDVRLYRVARAVGRVNSSNGDRRTVFVLLEESILTSLERLVTFSEPRHLKASHIKPWRDATDAERLDGANGLLLSPHINHLFDEGSITFSSGQEPIIVPEVRDKLLDAWGMTPACALASSRESRTPSWTITEPTCSSTRSLSGSRRASPRRCAQRSLEP
jgi:hypothetical protein